MDNHFLKKKKGQISIEFILLILIALIYISSIIQPTIKIASEGTEDVTRLSQAKIAAQKLAVSINQIEANQAEGKKTITLFVPENSSIECDAANNRINFASTMSAISQPPQCPGCESGCQGFDCKGFITLIAAPACDFDTLTTIDGGTKGIFRKVVVEKTGGTTSAKYAP